MTSRTDLEQITRQWIQLWCAPVDWSLFDRLHAPDFEDCASAGRPSDKAGFASGLRAMTTAFPDLRTAVDDLVVDEARATVAVRWSARGTNRSRYLGIGPTQRETTITGIEIIEIRGGRIVRRWGEWDITAHREETAIAAVSLYGASVPQFVHYLERLQATLHKAQAHARERQRPESSLLDARLADGMFPLAQQVSTACSFVLRACCPLLGLPEPPMAGGDQSFAQLDERIGGTLQFLRGVPHDRFSAAGAMKVMATAGFAQKTFDARDYVLGYALPNFFFHVSMAHAILRREGVTIGKHDFDGHHEYPAGFSFPAPTPSAAPQ